MLPISAYSRSNTVLFPQTRNFTPYSRPPLKPASPSTPLVPSAPLTSPKSSDSLYPLTNPSVPAPQPPHSTIPTSLRTLSGSSPKAEPSSVLQSSTLPTKAPLSPTSSSSLKKQGFLLLREVGPALMKEFGPPIARRIGPPLVRRLGPPLVQNIGLPLAKRVGLPIARKVALPLVKRLGGFLLHRIGF